MKISAIIAATAVAAAVYAPQEADAHAFLMLPKIQLTTNEKNMYAYVVPGEKVPPFSSYTTGNAESNSKGFETNYKKLNPASLKSFIMANQIPATSGVPAGGTAECGYSKMDQPALPLPDHIEFGNYQLSNREGIHPGPCEAWCDDDIVVPFTMDCRTILNKPIQYDKAKCQGKKRLTFYWLATHFAPFQVYIGCAPLQGGGSGGGTSSGGNAQSGNRNGGSGGNNPAGSSSNGNNGGNNNNNNGGNNNGGNNNNNNNNNGGNNNGGNNNNNNGGNNNGGNNNNNNNNNNGGNNNGGNNWGNNNGGQGNNNFGGNNNNNNNRNGGQGNNGQWNNGQGNNGQGNNNNGQNRNAGNFGRSRSLDYDLLSPNGTIGTVSAPKY